MNCLPLTTLEKETTMRPNYTTFSERDLNGSTRVRVFAGDFARSGSELTLLKLVAVDVIANGEVAAVDEDSFCPFISPDAFVTAANEADVVANALAGALRLHLSQPLPIMPWICLSKTAVGLSVGGNPPSLDGLANEFGVKDELEGRLREHGSQGAVAEMWATALVLAAMARDGCPIRRQLLMSQVITPPYIFLPPVDDHMAWRFLPDDLLHGLHKCTHDYPDTVVARALREIARRRAVGHNPDFRAINWRLPGVLPYGLGETPGE
jgi:hypothetical protein